MVTKFAGGKEEAIKKRPFHLRRLLLSRMRRSMVLQSGERGKKETGGGW